MSMKLNYQQASPGAVNAMWGLEKYMASKIASQDIEHSLLELIKMRVSQLNGCAFCLDMHSKDARAAGETEQRLYTLSAWRETPFFTEQERVVLAWAEALTTLATGHPDETLLDALREHFTDSQITDLTLAICAINSWNRFAIGFGAEVGSYKVGDFG
ncbi:carboxymuconolactone decarboxylase family protein [Neptunicella sp. SCSIO 80796]|uniref:carboxymuconolactone decarboxylase family protein n=1 Tax=Neptunicella plasticusilytica TaxID=3117012 RepID=UPI003A4E1C5E